MRFIALDVHRDFCQVAIKDQGELRSAGRVKTTVAELELFARSLGHDDQVAPRRADPRMRSRASSCPTWAGW